MQFEEAFEVATGQKQTFEYLADIRNEAKWNPWAIRVEKLSDGPIGKNARFRGEYKRIGNAEQWLSEYEPSSRLVYQADAMSGSMAFDIEPAGGRTSIRLLAQAHPTGMMRLLAPLMQPMMRRHIHDLAEGIKRELGG